MPTTTADTCQSNTQLYHNPGLVETVDLARRWRRHGGWSTTGCLRCAGVLNAPALHGCSTEAAGLPEDAEVVLVGAATAPETTPTWTAPSPTLSPTGRCWGWAGTWS